MAGYFKCSGTHRGEWRGHPPTGRRFEDVDEIYIFRVEDGKLASAIAVVEDNLTRMRQLGVRRALAAWNEGDFDGWLETAHPDIEWVPALVQLMEGTQTTYQGIPGLRRYWDDMHAIWDFSSEVAEARDLGNTVLVLGRILATGRVGAWMSMHPGGSWRLWKTA